LIALPATAGSGAEVTPTLGLFEEGRFRELRVPSLIPDRAILDPGLLAGLPREVAAAARFDALAHAVESCFSNLPGPMTDVHARAALPLLLNGPDSAFADADGRESLLYASSMAGLAAGNKHLGLAHAAANALCAHHPLPHGEALALVLPEVIRFNAKSAGKRAGALARAVNLEGAEALADRVEAFRLEIGLCGELPSAGPYPERCSIQPEAFVRDVLTSVHLPTNPRLVTESDVHRLLEKIRPRR
jgi:alcohol dehydrogenase class IV